MKVLIVGSGGREHAIVWKISQSPLVNKIFAAPGNGGIADIAQCVALQNDDIKGLREFAKKEHIDLTVIGPEAPLAAGIVDEFKRHGLRVFGPDSKAALLEGSKVAAKRFMKRNGIPTGDFKVFERFEDAVKQADVFGYPTVIKADGLAAGKGVIIAKDSGEARDALTQIMVDKKFGKSGDRVLVEEHLTGTEITVLCFVDGETIVPMESARDYKRVFDDDKGPNTGGMGSISPNDVYTEEIEREFREGVMFPTLEGLKREKIEYKGVLYFGLMVTEDGIKVLEYNCRFGDPETQVILPRLNTDLVEIMDSVIDGELSKQEIRWLDKSCVCVILASGGYPGNFEKGFLIQGLKGLKEKETLVFHGGTEKIQGRYYTKGGRVIGVTTLGDGMQKAREKAYAAAEDLSFEGMHYRRDIAK